MLAEKELQGCQQQSKSRSNYGSSYTPKAITQPPTKSTGASPAASPVGTRSTPLATSPSVSKNQLQELPKSASSVASTGRSSAIQCHRCQGLGHVARECPSKRAYVATDDGGYISTSNVEEDIEEKPSSNEDGVSLSIEDAGT
jgi:hypothetical protein